MLQVKSNGTMTNTIRINATGTNRLPIALSANHSASLTGTARTLGHGQMHNAPNILNNKCAKATVTAVRLPMVIAGRMAVQVTPKLAPKKIVLSSNNPTIRKGHTQFFQPFFSNQRERHVKLGQIR